MERFCIDEAHLEKFGANTARGLRPGGLRGSFALRARLRTCLRRTVACARRCREEDLTAAAARWLSDNCYLAEREARAVLHDLRRSPRLRHGPDGLPALYTLLLALIRCRRGRVDLPTLERYLDGVQQVLPLTAHELDLLPPLLTAALVDELSQLSTQTADLLFPGGADHGLFRAEAALLQAEAAGNPVSAPLRRDAEAARTRQSDLSERLQAVFTSLRLLSTADLAPLLRRISRLDAILSRDPAGLYDEMDDTSRAEYRRAVCRLARRRHQDPLTLAAQAVRLSGDSRGIARHVGYYLFRRPMGKAAPKKSVRPYLLSLLLPTALLTALAGLVCGAGACLLLLLPLSQLVKNTVDALVLRFRRPAHVFRLEHPERFADQARTLCVITAQLTGPEDAAPLAEKLKTYALTNRDAASYLSFGILADLPDSKTAADPRDGASTEALRAAVDALNRLEPGRFYAFVRPRQYVPADRKYTAPERKRGALLELARLLCGRDNTLQLLCGDAGRLRGTPWLLTLDSDTRLDMGTARLLVGAMLHPLNRPITDPRRRVVSRGHALLQPRMGVTLDAAGQSLFSRIFAGQGGRDPYSCAAGDVYMDLFGQGSYTGKGILHAETLLFCLDGRLPEGRVLSHDLLEGCYLRAGFAGNVELSDGFPRSVNAWLRRLHRWTRGDWQLIGWLGPTVPTAAGRERSPLDGLARLRIFDNLRRSLVSPALFAALIVTLCHADGRWLWVALTALLCTLSEQLLHLLTGLWRVARRGVPRYHSTVIAGPSGALLTLLCHLFLLPQQAWTCLSAIVTALWRLFVSGRGLLDWVVSQQEDRHARNDLFSLCRSCWFSLLSGLALLLLCPGIPGRALGLFWLLTPLLILDLNRPRSREYALSEGDRAFLLEQARGIWSWFREHCTHEDHHLPPDNLQQTPAVGLAHRTSPTNIGFAALAALTAVDLNLTTEAEALSWLRPMLSTVEQLESWQGHLLNWYDTRTLQPLHPRCVSSVDSGNFVACMITLARGLSRWDHPEARDLSRRASALAARCELAAVYDPERRLFRLGYDLERRCPMEGHYDLFASEARLTSYVAVARGEVPQKHWARLSRALTGLDGYRCPVSWTGTMFEYLMADLLLPTPENSLVWESSRFCVLAQRRRVQGLRRTPWGCSESAFYAFGAGLDYSYKAHGVQVLGLKQGLDRELVVAPYASFLALGPAPEAALRNLRRLASMGLDGPYGLCEAADFTRSRCVPGRDFMPVRSWMAHHLGMSLAAIDNALCQNAMQRRFLSEPCMGAHRQLLEEKVPLNAPMLRQYGDRIPQRPIPRKTELWRQENGPARPLRPRYTLLSDFDTSLLLGDSGQCCARWRGRQLYRFVPGVGVGGLTVGLWIHGRFFSLTPQPFFDSALEYRSSFSPEQVLYTAEGSGLSLSMTVRVGGGELRDIRLQSHTPLTGELILYFEPVLADSDHYDAHPAFSRLSLETSLLGHALVVRRRPRDGDAMALAVATDSPQFTYDTSREQALGRGGARRLPEALHRPAGATLGAVLDPCVLLRLPVRLEADRPRQLRIALASAEGTHAAASAADALLHRDSVSGNAAAACAAALSMTAAQMGDTMALLSPLLLPDPHPRGRQPGSIDTLWKHGISGDLPILLSTVEQADRLPALTPLLHSHSLLTRCGFPFDLVLVTRDGGRYDRPLATGAGALLRETGCEALLGQRGGIHLLDLDAEQTEQLSAFAALVLPQAPPSPAEAPGPLARPPRPLTGVSTGTVSGAFPSPGVYRFECRGTLPPVSWTHCLTNGRMGWVAADGGCGHLWHKNARENKLTDWVNDPLALDEPEQLYLCPARGAPISVFAGTGTCTVEFGPGYARWQRPELTVTAFIPFGADARILLVEPAPSLPPCTLQYHCRPRMAADRPMAAGCRAVASEDGILVTNPRNAAFPGQQLLFASGTALLGWTGSERSWLQGLWDGVSAVPGCAVAAEYRLEGPAVLLTGVFTAPEQRSTLLSLLDVTAARTALAQTTARWRALTGQVEVSTPEPRLDNYLNGWAAYQTLACRIMGRTSIYQSGGAYGFRDQLQDCANLADILPELCREQILCSAEHQFPEGDVQHWWHPTGLPGPDRGVRTHCSDDLLWLPYAVCTYLSVTGDTSLLTASAPYLASPPLPPEARDRYEIPDRSDLVGTVYDHCVRAIECVLNRGFGDHGLCLMLGGDWNDSMDKVGAGGRGESVWLSWFLIHVLELFAPLGRTMGDTVRADGWETAARELTGRCQAAFRQGRYLRAWMDDGTPLGVRGADQCAVDSITQSFSVLPRRWDPTRSREALQTAVRELYDPDSGVVRLLTPPFHGRGADPGYIAGYLPGVRENGGQYTHAGIWLAMACLRGGMEPEGWQLLRSMLPTGRDPEIYRTEPYVITADVYADSGHLGRGGWSWYTGAAGWYRRVALEDLLGLRIADGVLTVSPRLPADWPGYQALYRTERGRIRISVSRDGPPDSHPAGIRLSQVEGDVELHVRPASPSL